jgi:hypothetical protein
MAADHGCTAVLPAVFWQQTQPAARQCLKHQHEQGVTLAALQRCPPRVSHDGTTMVYCTEQHVCEAAGSLVICRLGAADVIARCCCTGGAELMNCTCMVVREFSTQHEDTRTLAMLQCWAAWGPYTAQIGLSRTFRLLVCARVMIWYQRAGLMQLAPQHAANRLAKKQTGKVAQSAAPVWWCPCSSPVLGCRAGTCTTSDKPSDKASS